VIGKHYNNYQERNKNQINISEQVFENYCKDKNIKIHKLGFDEKTNNINYFYTLHPIIRKLPDYIMEYKNKLHYVEVKGTNKLKLDDIKTYIQFYKLFCKDNSFQIAFVNIRTVKVKIINLLNIIKSIKNIPIKRFQNDNKQYYEIPIDNTTYK